MHHAYFHTSDSLFIIHITDKIRNIKWIGSDMFLMHRILKQRQVQSIHMSKTSPEITSSFLTKSHHTKLKFSEKGEEKRGLETHSMKN